MSEQGGTPQPAPAAAPAGAPSAPSGGAGSSTPNAAPTGGAAPSGQQAATPPTRAPMLIKHKATIGDAEHELELDIAEHVAAQKLRFKADGEEHELSWDEAQQRLPLAQGAFKRMSQSAEATKAAEAKVAEINQWRSRVEQTLRDPERGIALLEQALGGEENLLRAMEARVARRLADQKMTPEQRAARDEAQRRQAEIDKRNGSLSEREKQLQAREESIRKAEADRLVAQYRQEWPKALGEVGVKETPHTIRLMAGFMAAADKAGFQLSAAEAAREVKAEVQRLLGGIDGATLAATVPDAAQKLQSAQIEQLNATTPGRVAQRTAANAHQAPKPREQPPAETWEEMVERRQKAADRAYHEQRLRSR